MRSMTLGVSDHHCQTKLTVEPESMTMFCCLFFNYQEITQQQRTHFSRYKMSILWVLTLFNAVLFVPAFGFWMLLCKSKLLNQNKVSIYSLFNDIHQGLFLKRIKMVTLQKLIPFFRFFSLRFQRVPELTPTSQVKKWRRQASPLHTMTQKTHMHRDTCSQAPERNTGSNTQEKCKLKH